MIVKIEAAGVNYVDLLYVSFGIWDVIVDGLEAFYVLYFLFYP